MLTFAGNSWAVQALPVLKHWALITR